MGDIADAIIEGLMTPEGEWIGPTPRGRPYKPPESKTHKCPVCNRVLRGEQGLKAHLKDKHGHKSATGAKEE